MIVEPAVTTSTKKLHKETTSDGPLTYHIQRLTSNDPDNDTTALAFIDRSDRSINWKDNTDSNANHLSSGTVHEDALCKARLNRFLQDDTGFTGRLVAGRLVAGSIEYHRNRSFQRIRNIEERLHSF